MKLPPGLKYFVMAGSLGVLAVFLVHSYITNRVKVPIRAMDQVVVAETDISPGTPLAGRLLRVATWPRDIVPAKAFSNAGQLEGRVTLMPVAKGEPILLTKLAPEGTAAGLGGLLDPNRLAVTIKTDEVSGVAGFVNPGDRIDVLAEMPAGGSGGEHFSKLILQNLKVLSKGQVWDQTGDKKPQVVPTVTLEVSPEEAEILNLASFQGKIRLALRNQLNRTSFPTGGCVTSQLRPARVKGDTAPKGKDGLMVQVIKGMKVTYSQL